MRLTIGIRSLVLLMAGRVYTLALECDAGNGQVIANDTCACDPALSSMVAWNPVKQLCLCDVTKGFIGWPYSRIKERPCIMSHAEETRSAFSQDDYEPHRREQAGPVTICKVTGGTECKLCDAGDNLISNGGFELGQDPWTVTNEDQFAYVADFPPSHSGSSHWRDGTIPQVDSLSQEVLVPADGTYQLAFWLNNDNGTPNRFEVKVDGDLIDAYADLGAFDYFLWTYTFTLTQGTHTIEFGFQNVPAYFHLDDVSLQSCIPNCCKGEYLNNGVCTPCPVGKYSDDTGIVNECKDCPPYTTSAAGAATAAACCPNDSPIFTPYCGGDCIGECPCYAPQPRACGNDAGPTGEGVCSTSRRRTELLFR